MRERERESKINQQVTKFFYKNLTAFKKIYRMSVLSLHDEKSGFSFKLAAKIRLLYEIQRKKQKNDSPPEKRRAQGRGKGPKVQVVQRFKI